MSRKLPLPAILFLLCLLLLVTAGLSLAAPSQSALLQTQRIRFAAGATSAQVSGQVDGNTMTTYLLNALSGQQMQVSVSSPAGNDYQPVVSPLGSPLARAQAGAQSFAGTLPESGDYTFQVSAPVGTALTTYTLAVSVTGGALPQPGPTQRITFAQGANSATVTGQLAGYTVDYYLVNAYAGQQIQVSVTTPSTRAYISLITPSGAALARAQAGTKNYTGTLPETGDYTIRVSTNPGGPQIVYTLNVTITGSSVTPPPGYQRISFQPGATSAQVYGQVDGTTPINYVLEASAGQRMRLVLASPNSNAFLTVVSPGGTPLARAQNSILTFDQTLPESGDYRITVSSPAGTPTIIYLLNAAVTGAVQPTPIPGGTTQRISFPTGANSAQVSGQIDGNTFQGYLLNAQAGQRMQLSVSSPTGSAYLTVVSPNGTPLARAQNGTQTFDQTLPESGDYTIQVSTPAGTPTISFTLFVAVTGQTQPTSPQRIRFAAGSTAAQVSEQVDGNTTVSYVLEARAGQRMQVFMTSPLSNVYLTLVSPFGSPLARAQAGAQSFDGILPESGDYSLQVSAPVGTALTAFTLTVSVTG